MKVICAKRHPLAMNAYKDMLRADEIPLFFLAGPILGAPKWRHVLCDALQAVFDGKEFFVALPLRFGDLQLLEPHCLEGREDVFQRQLNWEQYYLDAASYQGAILFWLPVQVEPREDGSPYARDTYGELGEWRGRMVNDADLRKRVIVGGEEGFPGLSVIERNFEHCCHPDSFTLHQTIHGLAEAAHKVVTEHPARIKMFL